MSSNVFVIGAGGHARVVGSVLQAKGQTIQGYLDDSFDVTKTKKEVILGACMVGNISYIPALIDERRLSEIYLGIGSNAIRKTLFNHAKALNITMPSLIHPSAIIETDCKVGEASLVCLGALIATQVRLGRGVIVNTGVVIDHESKVGDFCHLAPKSVIAGRVCIEDNVFIGMGACIAQNITIGTGAVVGAGAIVLKDIKPGERVVGVHH